MSFPDRDLTALLPYLKRYALQLTRNAADADDLVQDTVIRALRYRAMWKPERPLKHWASVIMRSTFLTGCRSRARLVARVAGLPRPDEAGVPSVEDIAIAREGLRLFGGLRPDRQRILYLAAVGHGEADIAAMEGVPHGTIKSRLSRSRADLAALVEGRGL